MKSQVRAPLHEKLKSLSNYRFKTKGLTWIQPTRISPLNFNISSRKGNPSKKVTQFMLYHRFAAQNHHIQLVSGVTTITFSDSRVQKVTKGNEQKPMVVFEHESMEKRFFPKEISSMILKDLKEGAEAYVGREVTDAVITVPGISMTINDMQPKMLVKSQKIHVVKSHKLLNISCCYLDNIVEGRLIGWDGMNENLHHNFSQKRIWCGETEKGYNN